MNKIKTLSQFIIEKQLLYPTANGSLSRILRDIALAAKIVNREVNKAGLVNILGTDNTINIQGEQQQKLDIFANNTFIDALTNGKKCSAVASEENVDLVLLNSKESKYVVYIDPLDGSSNIDVNVSIGTIFSVYESPNDIPNEKNVLLKGSNQIASGYVIYGSSTMFVYTTGNGVNGFTLDPSIGEFCLSHPNLSIPKNGKIYSINEGNYIKFSNGIKKYIKYCQKENSRPYTSRYIGSLVADFHRNLIKGGIFIYPSTKEYTDGKLRLMYECNPMSMIIEQAGGKSIVGKITSDKKEKKILDIIPTHIHQRTPIIIGSKNMVDKVWKFIKKYD